MKLGCGRLMLIHYIKVLKEATLAKMIFSDQRRNIWSGLAAEATSICTELCIEDAKCATLSKLCYKKLVEKACTQKDEQDMKARMVSMTKLES
jgi:hypothetical protein